jgi:hypothetical protein
MKTESQAMTEWMTDEIQFFFNDGSPRGATVYSRDMFTRLCDGLRLQYGVAIPPGPRYGWDGGHNRWFDRFFDPRSIIRFNNESEVARYMDDLMRRMVDPANKEKTIYELDDEARTS